MGDAPRRAEPGEPRQPARGGQEREALVVRQPALRLVEREAPGAPVSRRSTRTTIPRSARWRTSTRRRSTTSASSSGPTTRPTTRSLSVVGDVDGPRCAGSRSATSAASRRTRPSRRWATCRSRHSGGEIRETVPDRVPLPRVYFGFRAPAFGDAALDALEVGAQILAGGKGAPAAPAPRARRADRAGRRRVRARLRRRRVDRRGLGDGAPRHRGRACRGRLRGGARAPRSRGAL